MSGPSAVITGGWITDPPTVTTVQVVAASDRVTGVVADSKVGGVMRDAKLTARVSSLRATARVKES